MRALLFTISILSFTSFGQVTKDQLTSDTGNIWHGINSGRPAYFEGKPHSGEVVVMKGGVMYEKWNFVNGIQTGEQFRYGPDGRASYKYTMLAGKLHGESVLYYFKSDQIKDVSHHKHGVKDGEFLTFYRDGQINTQRGYSDGKKHGEFLDYYENGQLREQIIWDHNRIAGDEIFYNEDGTIQRKRVFEDGKFIACEGDC